MNLPTCCSKQLTRGYVCSECGRRYVLTREGEWVSIWSPSKMETGS